MNFKIQISVETPEALLQSLSKIGRDLDAGKVPEVVNELTYLNWEHMLSIFTPEGQAIMEDFRRSEEEGPDAMGCDFVELLSESSDTHATLEEINPAITQGGLDRTRMKVSTLKTQLEKSRFEMKLHH